MLYFGMSYQFDMMSDNLVVYKGTKFTEYEDIEQEVEEEKSNFSILWDKALGAVPYIASYAGGLLTGFANSFLPIDFFDYSERSDAFRAGLLGGDILGAAVGMALFDAGSGGMVVGTTVVCTGVGAPVGVAIDAGSALAMGFGGLMMFNSARNATKPDRYKGSSSSGSSGGGKKPAEPYNRRKHYGDTPKKSDRKEIGGESVDHDPPLVKRYYEGDPKTGEKPGYLQTPAERKASANDRSRMQPSTKAEQNKQGAEMSKYSKEQKKKYGL